MALIDHTNAPAPIPEVENHELNGLAGLAAEVDGGAAAVAAPGDPNAPELAPAGPDYSMEARGAVDMLGAMICGYSPKCEPLWGDDKKAAMAASVAPVMEKYGFTFGAMPCEMLALVVCGPVLYQSAKVIGREMAEEKARAAAVTGQPAPASATAAPVEAPEVARHPQMALHQ